MSLRRRFGHVLALLAFVVLTPMASGAAGDTSKDGLVPVPALTSAVTDLTGTLSAGERQGLETKLRDWQARTTDQLAVLIVPSTAPEAIEQYSIRVAEAWKIGQKGQDNGAILLIAKDDKRMRIEVGYGLEGVLTDVTSRRIIAEDIAPEFSKGNFAAGINAGVDRIIAVVGAGEPLPAVSQRRPASRHGFDFGTMMIVLLVAAPVLGGILRSIFGKVGGSLVGGGVVGAVAWFIASSLLIAGFAAVAGFVIMLFTG
ncbi:MAG: TPM domain-containing protein, partial [Casimicrobiaceae bacterium]